ncbi:uncharacterized protein F4822DRAFT_433988 [Hypoxylon trugodes]|uniref:uncharacterized protein n=1 Tax=Hypoxylon trugodes TaxID=326681 RepID=UPI00218E365A|nr:uncharacterized protein F4822DRAFT_433988 [Hypoxylon trugodes]KAI1384039.1 hypothetical protein F4822DRAFT_433988 [Hypoxylon trugodes]
MVKARWEANDEVLDFILEQAIPRYALPRGQKESLYTSVAALVRERFGEDYHDASNIAHCTMKQVKYVVENYGKDPRKGNRLGNQIHLSTGGSPREEPNTGGNATAAASKKGANKRPCHHCGGSGLEPVDPKSSSGSKSSGPPNIKPSGATGQHRRGHRYTPMSITGGEPGNTYDPHGDGAQGNLDLYAQGQPSFHHPQDCNVGRTTGVAQGLDPSAYPFNPDIGLVPQLPQHAGVNMNAGNMAGEGGSTTQGITGSLLNSGYPQMSGVRRSAMDAPEDGQDTVAKFHSDYRKRRMVASNATTQGSSTGETQAYKRQRTTTPSASRSTGYQPVTSAPVERGLTLNPAPSAGTNYADAVGANNSQTVGFLDLLEDNTQQAYQFADHDGDSALGFTPASAALHSLGDNTGSSHQGFQFPHQDDDLLQLLTSAPAETLESQYNEDEFVNWGYDQLFPDGANANGSADGWKAPHDPSTD